MAFFAGAGTVATSNRKVGGAPLADQVRKAIDRGVNYLKERQQPATGSWDDKATIALSHPGGQTALVLLALLNAGVQPDDPVVKKGLEYLRKIERPTTYVRSLETLVFVEAGQAQDLPRIRANVQHLLKIAASAGNGNLQGWGYDQLKGGAPTIRTASTLSGLMGGPANGRRRKKILGANPRLLRADPDKKSRLELHQLR